MKNWIIIFNEKEGSSPLVRLLNNFERISVIHQLDTGGWEPFEYDECGPITLPDLRACLEIIYGDEEPAMDELNRIYTKAAPRPLAPFQRSTAVGFKIRFRAPQRRWRRKLFRVSKGLAPSIAGSPLGERIIAGAYRVNFRKYMLDLIKRRDIVVFLTARQDVFRLGLSKYHGDGSGRAGHLQFRVASGKVDGQELDRIHVDLGKLGSIIADCEQTHERKRKLKEELEAQGTRVVPLLYEDFVEDKVTFFRKFSDAIEVPVTEDEIRRAVDQGAYFKKVHSNDISKFVENHQEVMDQFGGRFVSWRESLSS